MKKLIILRRVSQALFLSLFLYAYYSIAYSLYRILPLDIFSGMDPFMTIFASIGGRTVLPAMAFALFMLVVTLILGRFFCGWICPLGTVIDICGSVRKKKIKFTESQNRVLTSLKFYILGIVALFSFLGMQIAGVFDPMAIMFRFLSLDLRPLLFGADGRYYFNLAVSLLFFLLICVSTVAVTRFWCRALCPLGALYSIVARFSLLHRTVEKCTGCFKCKETCRMAAIKDGPGYIKSECILCMDCIYDCPAKKTKFTWFSPQ